MVILRRFHSVVTFCLAGAILTPSVFGQQPPVSVQSSSVQARLGAIDAQLHRREWLPARDSALLLIDEIRATLVASDLAGAVARLALADAGLNHPDEALWHWHIAQNLDRSVLSSEELATYGPPGELLARHPLRRIDGSPAGLTVVKPEASRVRPGRRLSGTAPKLSSDIVALPVPKSLRLQAIVDIEGRLREPVLVAGEVPGMVYQMLAGLRDWRYEPARRGKTPVAIFRNLSFDLSSEPATTAPPHLSGVEALLRRGNWKGASEEARKAWNQAFNALGYSQKGLAFLLSLRALADAGMGMESNAVCRWQAAQHLDPGLLDTDLSPYGAAGDLLEKSRRDEIPERFSDLPEMQKRSRLSFPNSAYWPKLKGSVRLSVTVDAAGRIRQPMLLGADGNDLPLLEGLRRSAAVSASPEGDYFATLLAAGALDSACDWQIRSDSTGMSEPFRTVLTVPFRVSPDYRGTQFVGPRTIGLGEPTLRGREGNPKAPWGTNPPTVRPPD